MASSISYSLRAQKFIFAKITFCEPFFLFQLLLSYMLMPPAQSRELGCAGPAAPGSGDLDAS